MYSIVMMMALSNGAAAPAVDAGYAPVVRTGSFVAVGANKKCGCDCGCKGCKGCKCDCGCKGCKKCHKCNGCYGCYVYTCACHGGAVAGHHAMADVAPVYLAQEPSNK